MKTCKATFRSLVRTAIACVLACVFIFQTSLVVSAHQRTHHAPIGFDVTISGQLDASPICSNALTGSDQKSGSHLNQSDCCLFCQLSHDSDNAGSVIVFAKVIATLAPIAKELEPSSWMEYRPMNPSIIGLKNSWSAQAPPKA